jgi:hypothetical protein
MDLIADLLVVIALLVLVISPHLLGAWLEASDLREARDANLADRGSPA